MKLVLDKAGLHLVYGAGMKTPKDYLSEIGKRGGLSRSPAKLQAIQRNLKRAWAQQRKTKAEKSPETIGANRLQNKPK